MHAHTWEQAGGEQHGSNPEPALVPRVEASGEESADERGERVADDEGGEDGAALLKVVARDGEQDDGKGQQGQLAACPHTG